MDAAMAKTTIPRRNDVLFGKGAAINSHNGNRRLRSLVELQREDFAQQEKRAGKRAIAQSIVNEIHALGGRFLEEDPGTKGDRLNKDGGAKSWGNAISRAIHSNPDRPDDSVTDFFILDKLWIHVDQDKALKKVMHRLREKRETAGVGKQHLHRPDDSLLKQPPETEPPAKIMSHSSSTPGPLVQMMAGHIPGANPMPASVLPPSHQPEASAMQPFIQQPCIDGVASQVQAHVPIIQAAFSQCAPFLQFQIHQLAMQNTSFPGAAMHAVIQQPLAQLEPCATGLASSQSAAALLGGAAPDPVQNFVDPTKNGHINATASGAQSTHHMGDLNDIPSSALKSNGAGSARSVPMPVSIQGWTRLALEQSPTANDYLDNAVNLSWFLTQRLMQLISNGEVKLMDIVTEGVQIYIDGQATIQSGRLTINAVEIKPSALPPLAMAKRSQEQPLTDSSPEGCSALGSILLEIFSKGQPRHGQQAGVPPMKRKLSASSSSASSEMSNLLEEGAPAAVRRLVSDLISADNISLSEALFDLAQMRDIPQLFLHDRTCRHDTHLFAVGSGLLVGRELELETLARAKQNISNHVRKAYSSKTGKTSEEHSFDADKDFLCEAVFLSGYPGGGKSSVLQSFINDCKREGWFIISCKFDHQVSPTKPFAILMKAIDDFFRARVDEQILKVWRSIILSTLDKEGIGQLCGFIPSLNHLFPEITASGPSAAKPDPTSNDHIGTIKKRRRRLFHVLFEAICSAGRPLLIALDDLHWAGENILDTAKEFMLDYAQETSCNLMQAMRPKGVLTVGTYRCNEVRENEGIMITINAIEQSKSVKLTKLPLGDLTHDDICKLISTKLCLPRRYTHELAGLVLSKTRGNPFFVTEFLKSIIQNRLLEYSVGSCRWEWDYDLIDMQMISDGMAQLLTARFDQLPRQLIETVRIASCFGSQIDRRTIDALNNDDQFNSINMKDQLQLAVQECILEKAGPLYQFTHDLVQQAVYDSIPAIERKRMHRAIGMALLRFAHDNGAIHLLAVDQINIFAKDTHLSPQERAQFAAANATAAKYAIESSSSEPARIYIDTGMKLLDDNHWDDQYSLSLKLYEMSASLACMNGDTDTMYSCLNQIIASAKSFEDSLTSNSLLSKLLASQSKHMEAIEHCTSILLDLGEEEFPEDIDPQMVSNELSAIQKTLVSITLEQVKELPQMTNKSKLHAMKFMSMLCSHAQQSKPLLVPVVSCRMVRITTEDGFCDDSTVGLVTAGLGLFSFTDDIELGYRIGKVGESLIEESSNKDSLRSRLAHELATLKSVFEPAQSIMDQLPARYNSAMLSGDVSAALHCRRLYCTGCIMIGMDLAYLSKQFIICIEQSIKYKQNTTLLSAMTFFRCCMHLSGQECSQVKSHDELHALAVRTNDKSLLYQNNLSKMWCHFWVGEYLQVVKLSENFRPAGQKRVSEVYRLLFEGISVVKLARQTQQQKWKERSQEYLADILKWSDVSKHNYQSQALLLQAECHYLNRDIQSADAAYRSSIVAAHDHKFPNFEALSLELHGIFLLENDKMDEGKEQLLKAIVKYSEWGATRKVKDLQSFMATDELALPHMKV